MPEIKYSSEKEEPIYTTKDVENVRKNIIGCLASEISQINTELGSSTSIEAYKNSMRIVNDCWKNISNKEET